VEEEEPVARTQDGERPGLRERKKARTRGLIQSHALRLFREQGYKETSVEQIAEAAEVSPSTVFHYFPTKADLVLYDAMDDQLLEAFRAVPADIGGLQAMRQAMRQVFGELVRTDIEVQLERERLLRTVPELRAAMIEEFARTMRVMVELLAERSGQPTDDDTLQILAGAVIGVGLAAWFANDDDALSPSFVERMDKGIALLESGFHL
jgi:AcrR family transcriptional regulator